MPLRCLQVCVLHFNFDKAYECVDSSRKLLWVRAEGEPDRWASTIDSRLKEVDWHGSANSTHIARSVGHVVVDALLAGSFLSTRYRK